MIQNKEVRIFMGFYLCLVNKLSLMKLYQKFIVY